MSEQIPCTAYGNISIPADKQRSFCARQHRLGKPDCIDCERGKDAARTEAEEIRESLPESPPIGLTVEEKERRKEKEKLKMPTTVKKCIDCGKDYTATSNVQKRCKKCGEAHKAGGTKPAKKRPASPQQPPAAVRPRKDNGRGEPVEHYESVKIINTLLSTGALTIAQVEATREYIRKMEGRA